jgi:hypothetical protein
MGYYLTQRAEIKAQLEAVLGIGKVYDIQKNPTSIDAFKTIFVSGGVVNACMISRVSGVELENGIGSLDESEDLNFVQKDDQWEIELRYGFDEDISETVFNNLIDAIETKFRFLSGLNNIAYRSFPLQRTQSGIFAFQNGLILCHKAVWRIQIQERVENPEVE